MITCSLFWLADFMRRPWNDLLTAAMDRDDALAAENTVLKDLIR
jgi:hypothetical protein